MALKDDCVIEPFALSATDKYQNDTTGIVYTYVDWLNKDTKQKGLIPGGFVSSLSLNTAIQQASLGSAVLMQALNGTPEIPKNRISNATVSHSALISDTIQVDKYTDYATRLLAQLSTIYQLNSEINTLSDLLSSSNGWEVKQDITFTGIISTSANKQQDIPNIKNKDLVTRNIYAESDTPTSGGTSIPIIAVGYDKPTAKEDKPVTINTDNFNIYTKYQVNEDNTGTLSTGNSSIQNAARCIESLATRLKSAETKINELGFKSAEFSTSGADSHSSSYMTFVSGLKLGKIIALTIAIKFPSSQTIYLKTGENTKTVILGTVTGIPAPESVLTFGSFTPPASSASYTETVYTYKWDTDNRIKLTLTSTGSGRTNTLHADATVSAYQKLS